MPAQVWTQTVGGWTEYKCTDVSWDRIGQTEDSPGASFERAKGHCPRNTDLQSEASRTRSNEIDFMVGTEGSPQHEEPYQSIRKVENHGVRRFPDDSNTQPRALWDALYQLYHFPGNNH